MIRAVIDTNLFISYLIGKKLKALDAVLKEKKAILIVSQLQLEELKAPKSRKGTVKRLSREDLQSFLDAELLDDFNMNQ